MTYEIIDVYYINAIGTGTSLDCGLGHNTLIISPLAFYVHIYNTGYQTGNFRVVLDDGTGFTLDGFSKTVNPGHTSIVGIGRDTPGFDFWVMTKPGYSVTVNGDKPGCGVTSVGPPLDPNDPILRLPPNPPSIPYAPINPSIPTHCYKPFCSYNCYIAALIGQPSLCCAGCSKCACVLL